MPSTLEDKRDYIERAAKAYVEFKFRTKNNELLTLKEKRERIWTFLEAHVDVFDEYYKELKKAQDQENQRSWFSRKIKPISVEAYAMANDIAATFPSSTREALLQNPTVNRGTLEFFQNRADLLYTSSNRRNTDQSYMQEVKGSYAEHMRETGRNVSEEEEADAGPPLTEKQVHGIRSIGAFLYRNTIHGTIEARMGSGFFVDGILKRSPKEKLLMFYLIEKDKLHGNLNRSEMIKAMAYEPNLDEFKPRIFNGLFRGAFNRAEGESLDWDKLSDAAHVAEDMMPAINTILGDAQRDPGAVIAAAQDPELADAIREVSAAGRLILQNPNPPEADLNRFKETVDALNAYLSREEKSEKLTLGTVKSKGESVNKYVGYVSKLLGTITKTLGMTAKLSGEEKTGSISHMKSGFSWDTVPLGMISTLVSCITLLESCVKLATKPEDQSVKENMLQLGRVSKNFVSTQSGIFGSVRGISGLAGQHWGSSPAVSAATGGVAIAAGFISGIQGIYRIYKASKKIGEYEIYEEELDNLDLGADATEEQIRELNLKRPMLLDISAAQRKSQERSRGAARLQTASAALQIVSGGLMLGSGGTLAVISAVVSATALVIGISGAVMNYYKKKAEKEDVVDNFLGMDELYERFKREHKRNGESDGEFEKRYGEKQKTVPVLRMMAMSSLGFYSVDKMHAYIMWEYAQALYNGAFLKSDGTNLTFREYMVLNGAALKLRKMYVDLIEKMNLVVKYPGPDEEPSPSAKEIYKKLTG